MTGCGFTATMTVVDEDADDAVACTAGMEVAPDMAARADADRSDDARGGGGGGGLVPNDPKVFVKAGFLPSEDCPLRSFLEDRRGGIGGAGPFAVDAGWKGTMLIGWGTGNFASVSGVVGS